ncbi:hypothetical protein I3760_01G051200 [Carya illinoinensis]|nr:hypothetical protein I3760_01G051200 [Carya illinoinensis]
MFSMASSTLEITVISGEDIRNNRKPVKKNAFAVIRTDSQPLCRTEMDKDGGSYPYWNEKHNVEIPQHARFITVEVQCKTSVGDKTLGMARIPVSDFVGGFVPQSYLHFLSYRLRNSNEERNGIINVSVKAKVPEYAASSCSSTATTIGVPFGKTPCYGGVVPGVPVGVPIMKQYYQG